MEVKIRIIEFSPKIKTLKNSPKDIISISFLSDNFSVKIADVEKAITSNEKVLINIKELKDSKNKIQPIKYILKRNENIIVSGEFIPIEGIKWYTLNEIYNNMSKESLITSSTSNGNIKNNNRRAHNLSDYNYSYGNEPMINNYTKHNSNHLNSARSTIKIKFAINFLKSKVSKKIINNDEHYNTIINNNYTNEPSENSKYEELFFDKDKDIFNEVDLTLLDSETSKLNKKLQKITKKGNNQKTLKTLCNKRYSKKKNTNNSNQCQATPLSKPGGESNINSKVVTNTINNSKIVSPKRKMNLLSGKKLFGEEMKMKTSINFNVRKNIENKEVNSEKKYLNQRIGNNYEIKRKLKSCENIEDEILDQNFKNYLKNDEILKANLSRNNSFTNLIQNNCNNNNNGTNATQQYQNTCNSSLPQTSRKKIVDSYNSNTNTNTNINNNKNKKKKIIPKDLKELNDNQLYNSGLQLFQNNNDEYDNILTEILPNKFKKNIKKNNLEENLNLTNTSETYEGLKNDFLLLYSNENIKKMNNDVLLLELQLMIEKILILQDKHQKEYINLFNSININKNVFNTYQNKYILLFKQMNKLQAKKIFNDIKDKKKELFNDNITNFINTRSKIMNKGEFIIWRKMMEKSNKSKTIDNNKSKITNIFLNICSKNENILNKLSFKFYKEIKNRQTKNINKKSVKNINKFYSNSNFSERKSLKMNIKINETDSIPYLNTNYNIEQNPRILKSKSIKKKNNKISKNNTKINIKDINNTNNINFGTVVTESASNKNVKKFNKCKKQSSSFSDKFVHKKKVANKSQ